MIKDVDTLNGTVYLRIGIWQRWHDPRIAARGQSRTCQLPPNLWSPRPVISPKLADFVCYTAEFQQQPGKDAEIGDLYTLTWFEGHIVNLMDLHPFPFDIDDVEFEILASECFLKSGETNASYKTDYRWLLEGSKKKNDRFKMSKNVEPHGWHAIATEIEYVNTEHEQDVVRIKIHIARIWTYYMYKVLVPLLMIVIVNFAQVFFPVDELSGKMEHVTALFLSTFALLYVLSSDLPKTSFQTPIDWVILFTMLVLALSGIIAVLCAYIGDATDHSSPMVEDWKETTANTFSTIGVTVLSVLYFVTIFALSFPNYLRRRRAIARLRAQADSKDDLILVGVDDHIAKIKADPHKYGMPDTLYKPWHE
eukprot:CAMPEP_0172724262 /NCGR_PEP_ID=MMETSP1074-20121228/85551_1 /TAXON_ID=2916 /ORGANISM="Ceratium fusus, Strain PA161109" /LENGTH=364 /DNA_ID=CAMNT_0013550681 /DNA_START=251 /DNA_END=1345 /DNA_ORIENTATION=-